MPEGQEEPLSSVVLIREKKDEANELWVETVLLLSAARAEKRRMGISLKLGDIWSVWRPWIKRMRL